MVLDYVPCDVYAFSDLFMDYNELKGIPEPKQEEMLFNLLDDRFCKYINKKGKYKGCLCMRKFRYYKEDGIIYCHTHRYQEKKCNIDGCDNKCKKKYTVCTKHFNLKIKYKTNIIIINENIKINNEDGYIDPYAFYYPPIDIYNIRIIDILKRSDKKTSEKNIPILFCKNRFNTLNEDIKKYLLFIKHKRIIYLKIKAFMKFNYILNKNKNVKNDIKKLTFVNNFDNNKCLLEFYLSNMYYIIKNSNSILLLKSNLLNILQILSYNISLNIDKDYLSLVDDNCKNKYKVKIEIIPDDTILKHDLTSINLDNINNKLDFNILRKIDIKDSYTHNGYKYLKLIKYGNCKLNNDSNKKTKMSISKINFQDIFEEIKENRNNIIIKNNLHILVLKDLQFQNDMFETCMGLFNKYSENSKEFDELLDVAIKFDIIPYNDKNDKLLSYAEYKKHLLNLNIKDKLDENEKLHIEKYLEFVFKSYNYVRYNKTQISKEDEKIKNILLKKQ